MKLNITNLVFIFLLCIMTLQVNAQNNCGDDSKISTNPDDPINEREDPGPYSKLNRDMFDWRLEYYPIYCNSPYHQGYDFILSPLWDNDAKYNFIYKEFRPEDGWELIKEKRGYVSETDRGDEKKLAPDAFLWVVLYNRYSSILRVFVSVKQYEDYTGSKLSLSFVDEPANLKTNLLR